MADRNELIAAAELLKEYCGGIEDCYKCIFDGTSVCPGLTAEFCPGDWVLPKPRRFTDEDIALAKALKAFGVEYIYKIPGGRDERACLSKETIHDTSACLPRGAFKGIKSAQTVSLDEIIAEGEK